jgi:acyl dehydratase
MASNGNPISFDEINIGDPLGPEDLLITKEKTRTYARDCWMDAPRFTDDEGARKEGLPGIIVPGNMSLALLGKLVTDWLGAGGGRLVRLSTTYRMPVYPDCAVTLQGFVTRVDESGRRAEIDVWMENEDAERLVIGTATVQFPSAG